MSTEYKDGKITMQDNSDNTVVVRPYTISKNVILESEIGEDFSPGTNMTDVINILNNNNLKIVAEPYKFFNESEADVQVADFNNITHNSVVIYFTIKSDDNTDDGENVMRLMDNNNNLLAQEGISLVSQKTEQGGYYIHETASGLLVYNSSESLDHIHLNRRGVTTNLAFIACFYNK